MTTKLLSTQDPNPTRKQMIDAGYITARRHPTEPLTIFNYTARTQIEHLWNEHTIQCRGLIEHDDGTVVVVFEAARRIGERCLALREHLAPRANVDPLAPLVEIPEIGAALRSARDVDASGAFLLFCLSTVVVPFGET